MTLRHLRIKKRLYRFFFTASGGKQMINGEIYVPEFTFSLWCVKTTLKMPFPITTPGIFIYTTYLF